LDLKLAKKVAPVPAKARAAQHATRLTSYKVGHLKPPTAGRTLEWDAEVPGLAVRLSSSGSKTWVFQGRVRGQSKSNPQKHTLGPYPLLGVAEARQRARALRDQMQGGVDPRATEEALDRARAVEQEAKLRNSFGAVRERFLKAKAPWHEGAATEGAPKGEGSKRHRAKTNAEYARVLRGADFKAWENKPIADITRRDVGEVIEKIEERISYIAAGKAFAFVRSMFNWAVKRNLLDSSPTARVEAPDKPESRDRVLTDDELVILLGRVRNESMGHFGTIYRLLALTGQRLNEIAALRWDEVHLDGAEPYIELPQTRTKNKRAHVVPLAPAAMEILRRLEATRSFDTRYVFTTTGTTPVSGFSKAKARLDASIDAYRAFAAHDVAAAGDQRAAERINAAFSNPWRVHDLRRTMVSGMNSLGVQPHIVEAIVNHISGAAKAGVAGVYNRAQYLPERRAALEKWARHLKQLESGKGSGALTPLRRIAQPRE
jgi:integrase